VAHLAADLLDRSPAADRTEVRARVGWMWAGVPVTAV
jgi:hypothetical protein